MTIRELLYLLIPMLCSQYLIFRFCYVCRPSLHGSFDQRHFRTKDSWNGSVVVVSSVLGSSVLVFNHSFAIHYLKSHKPFEVPHPQKLFVSGLRVHLFPNKFSESSSLSQALGRSLWIVACSKTFPCLRQALLSNSRHNVKAECESWAPHSTHNR